jgi:serine/threonine protein kinase
MVLGIMYLHEHGVAHLDMSLENVCLDSNDTIRIIDFGVAAIHPLKSKITSAAQYFSFPSSVMLLSTQTQNQSHESSNRSFICKAVQEMDAKPGKIRYMSPELLRGVQWDAFANDVFCLGVILYTLLTGHPPFLQAADTDGWFHAISSGHWLTAQMRELPNARVYNHLSNPVLDLLNSILEPEGSRATCEQILLHPWMQQVL